MAKEKNNAKKEEEWEDLKWCVSYAFPGENIHKTKALQKAENNSSWTSTQQ